MKSQTLLLSVIVILGIIVPACSTAAKKDNDHIQQWAALNDAADDMKLFFEGDPDHNVPALNYSYVVSAEKNYAKAGFTVTQSRARIASLIQSRIKKCREDTLPDARTNEYCDVLENLHQQFID